MELLSVMQLIWRAWEVTMETVLALSVLYLVTRKKSK